VKISTPKSKQCTSISVVRGDPDKECSMRRKKPDNRLEETLVISQRRRVGDRVIEVEIKSFKAVIAFDDLLTATTWEYDNDSEPPWNNDGYYSHELVRLTDDHPCYTDIKNAKTCVHINWHNRYLVELKGDAAKIEQENYEYYRKAGYAKQPAREKAAEDRAKIIKTIAGWHDGSEPWVSYSVSCDFGSYESSLHGIDLGGDNPDRDPYIQECRYEQALEVASEMEKDGFEVTNTPKGNWLERLHGYKTIGSYPHLVEVSFKRLAELKAKWHPLLAAKAAERPDLARWLIKES